MSGDIETLIKEFSEEMAARMHRASENAASEEDIRHECNKLLDEFVTRAGLSIKGRHEYGLAGGRVDSKYGGVVIEYKFPKGIGRIGESREAPGSKAVVEQVQQRFLDLRSEENVELERIFGVGCDGRMVVFVRARAGAFEAENPLPVTPLTVERWLRALVSVGARGLSFTPDNLALKFGSESSSAGES
ncbi:MAG: hypothetical protein HUU16_10945, partial [Candidatus Omnitrophica bacterium]|nr:hypothetical protein [Candidatus Omnitrophota bacterium]